MFSEMFSRIDRRLVFPVATMFLLLLADVIIAKFYTDSTNVPIFPKFVATDLYGESVTDETFAANFRAEGQNLTVVCLWLADSPDESRAALAEAATVKKNHTNDVAVMGLVGDLRPSDPAEKFARARAVANAAGADFPQIAVNDDFADVLWCIKNAPTIFFVAADGKIVGQSAVGNAPALAEKEAARILDGDSPRARSLATIGKAIFSFP